MNIVEAYHKFKGQYIILISGFSGSGKTALGKFIAKIFGFELVKLERFERSKEEYDKEENYVTLKNDIRVLDWDNITKSIDWDRFNSHINDMKSKTGLVIVGFGFPTDLLKFEPDTHIHLKTSKKTLVEKREKYMKKHPDDPFNKLGEKYENSMLLTLNTVTFPHYLSFMKESKLDKFINGNELDVEGIRDEAFSYIMHITKQWHKGNPQPDQGQTQSTAEAEPTAQLNVPQELIDRTLKDPASNEYLHTDRKRYDFNSEGIDYPESYKDEHGEKDINDYPDVSGSDTEEIDAEYSEIIGGDSSDTGDSESIFLGTFRENN
jgi:adenylate kinase family enzyme